MIELPEARTIARDLRAEIIGKTILSVGGNYTDHRFTFYSGNPEEYNALLSNRQVTGLIDRNYYVEIEIENYLVLLRDGANVRYHAPGEVRPEKSKLLLEFDDGSFVSVTTSMYSFIGVRDRHGEPDNSYYELELVRAGALDAEFTFDYFCSLISEATLKLSTKAFLATEQRILGIGNGVTQDILFNARLNPRRKMNTLSAEEVEKLYESVVSTLKTMVEQGGRDTEKTIYGTYGGYKTILSNKTYRNGCPVCGTDIIKEQFLGGSVYYCPSCQRGK
jgi:formamidopyrimidine-DNA glycosylase